MIYSINMHTTVDQFRRFVYHHEQSVIDHYARISLYTQSFCTKIRLHVYHLSRPHKLRHVTCVTDQIDWRDRGEVTIYIDLHPFTSISIHIYLLLFIYRFYIFYLYKKFHPIPCVAFPQSTLPARKYWKYLVWPKQTNIWYPNSGYLPDNPSYPRICLSPIFFLRRSAHLRNGSWSTKDPFDKLTKILTLLV